MDHNPVQDPEPDSGSCIFKEHLPVSLLQAQVAVCSQVCQTEPWPPEEAQHPESWSARVPPPVPLADPSASALRSLLTSLQQQIVRQREEYEERIIRYCLLCLQVPLLRLDMVRGPSVLHLMGLCAWLQHYTFSSLT